MSKLMDVFNLNLQWWSMHYCRKMGIGTTIIDRLKFWYTKINVENYWHCNEQLYALSKFSF